LGTLKPFGLPRPAVLAGGLLVALLLLDVASLLLPALGRVGVVLWCGSWLALGAHAVACLRRTVADARATGQGWVTLAVLAGLAGLVFAGTLDSRLVHFETCHELGCAVGYFADDPGWGYNRACLFNYPARQFIVPALPTLLLGRSYFALTFGSFLYLLVALPIFARGLLDELAGRRHADLATAVILTFPLHLRYFNHFMFAYEESIYPFLNALIFTGLALQLRRRGDPVLLPLVGLGMLHMVWGYTTSLALFGLAAVWLVHRLVAGPVRAPAERRTTALVLGVASASFALSWLVRADFHAFGERTGGELLGDLGEALRHILLLPPETNSAFMSPFVYPFVLLALLGALVFLDGWRGFVVGVWAVAVLLAAVILHGYWYYHVPLRVHRWLVVFPPLFALLAAFAARLAAPPRWSRRLLVALLAGSLVTGWAFHHAYVWTRPPSRQLAVARFLQRQPSLHEAAGRPLLITELMSLEDEALRDGYANHWQFLLYFLPGVDGEAVVSEDQHCPQILDKVVEAKDVPRFLLAPEGQKGSRCFPAARLEPLADFRFGDDPPLVLYRFTLPDHPAD
jgi:hypothetical protein